MKKGTNGESSNRKPFPTTTTIPTPTPPPPPHNMKTRDLPNLSECHACAFRLDTCTTGKSTLQLLYSEWRIVLLCHKCLSRVESSQICSYCFNPIAHDFFTCCYCNRCVHRNCFYMYKSVAPWSYVSSAASQFSCCVDCWVPNSIIRKRALLRARRSSNTCPELCNSDLGGKNCAQSLEANGDGDREAVVPQKAVVSKSLDQGVILDDVEFAFQLHRVMNSSPRISRSFGAGNSSCLSVPEMKECHDGSMVGGLGSRDSSVVVDIEVYDKLNGNPLVCVENENMVMPFKEGEGSCLDKLVKSSGDENSMNVECVFCQTSDGKCDRYLLKYRKRNSVANGVLNDKSKTLCGNFSCQSGTSVAPFLFKYRKRNLSSKGTSNDTAKTHYGRFFCQRETLTARYLLKYRKRKTGSKAALSDKSKAFYERLLHQNQDLAAELPLISSGEFKASSNDLLQSCSFPPQASASASC